jgi:hypothetical protein
MSALDSFANLAFYGVFAAGIYVGHEAIVRKTTMKELGVAGGLGLGAAALGYGVMIFAGSGGDDTPEFRRDIFGVSAGLGLWLFYAALPQRTPQEMRQMT